MRCPPTSITSWFSCESEIRSKEEVLISQNPSPPSHPSLHSPLPNFPLHFSLLWNDLASTTYRHCCCLVSKSCLPLFQSPGLYPARLLCPWAFSRQEHWKQLLSPPGDLPNWGTERVSCTGRWILYHGATGKTSHRLDMTLKSHFLFQVF